MTQTNTALAPEAPVVDLPEISFPSGLPGFPDSRRFALVRWGADPAFSVLVDLERPDTRFLVVPPDVFYPGYEAVLDDLTCALLELADAGQALLLVIVNLSDPTAPTANLLGPIVINIANRRGVQAVLSDVAYAARTPIPLAQPSED